LDDPRLIQLWQVASRFRAAIERCDRKGLTICLQNFPFGSCGDATPLLGTYFIEQGLGTFTYTVGLRQAAILMGINHMPGWKLTM